MDEASVRVALRVRPLNTKEQLQNCSECIGFVPGQAQVVLGSARAYAFDFVFQPNSSQVEIFQQAAHPLIEKFFEGYNTTVLAYGQVCRLISTDIHYILFGHLIQSLQCILLIDRKWQNVYDGHRTRCGS